VRAPFPSRHLGAHFALAAGLAAALPAAARAETPSAPADSAAALAAPPSTAPLWSTPLNGPHVLREKSVRLKGEGEQVLRSGPGPEFAIVATGVAGDEYKVVAKRGDWLNLRLDEERTGWVHRDLCEEFDDLSGLEFRPNPRVFSRVGSFSLRAYTGAYAFDRKSNSLVLGGSLGYQLLDHVEIEGGLAWTRVARPAEIVESLFNLALEEERFDMLYYSFNLNLKLLPGRQMEPFLTGGLGSSILRGQTESSVNLGAGSLLFFSKRMAMRWEFRNYRFASGAASARRDNNNVEFSLGSSLLF
jgi:outer membrane beta-barrel protein